MPIDADATHALVRVPAKHFGATVPALFARAGDKAVERLVQFFTAEIRNPNTRATYAHAVSRFDRWCQMSGLALRDLTPFHVASYVEQIGTEMAKPSVKVHLAAVRMLCDYLVIGQVIPFNPATSVRGPKYVLKKGKTPVLTGAETRSLFAGIETNTVIGLRDRALIGVMAYSFARISAVLGMNVEDFYQQGKQSWVRLHEKGGKEHDVPAHHTLVDLIDRYQHDAGIENEKGTPSFAASTGTRSSPATG